jgi:hypothetical protein
LVKKLEAKNITEALKDLNFNLIFGGSYGGVLSPTSNIV